MNGTILLQRQTRHPAQDRADGDLRLDSRQPGAEAGVNTTTECDMSAVAAGDIKPVGTTL